MFRLLKLDFMPNKEATCIPMRGSRERERGGGQGGQEPNLFMQNSNFSKLYYKMNKNLHMPLTSPLANLYNRRIPPPGNFFLDPRMYISVSYQSPLEFLNKATEYPNKLPFCPRYTVKFCKSRRKELTKTSSSNTKHWILHALSILVHYVLCFACVQLWHFAAPAAAEENVNWTLLFQ